MEEKTIQVFCGLNKFSIADENGMYEKFSIDEFFDTIMFPLYDYSNKCFKDVICRLPLNNSGICVCLKGIDGKLLIIVEKAGWEMFELCIHASSLDGVFTSYAFASLLFLLSRDTSDDDWEKLQNDIYNWTIALLYKQVEAKHIRGEECMAFHSLTSLVVKNEDTPHGLLMCGIELT
jgi:hypothetical protein